jgi:hypothetical protein
VDDVCSGIAGSPFLVDRYNPVSQFGQRIRYVFQWFPARQANFEKLSRHHLFYLQPRLNECHGAHVLRDIEKIVSVVVFSVHLSNIKKYIAIFVP